MNRAVFDAVLPVEPPGTFPAEMVLRVSKSRTLLISLMVLPFVSAAVIAVLALASTFTLHPEGLNLFADNPAAIVKLGLAISLTIAVAWLPVRALFWRLGRHRTVAFHSDQVHVRDQSLLGKTYWTAHFSSFRGVVHHVRATLSGAHHELFLVHPDPKRTILLHTAANIPQSTIDHYADLVALPELAARELYRQQPVARAA
jgi:hypothetical protein